MTPQEAYKKAKELGERIPKLEGIILKDAAYSFYYAKNVIKGKFELSEPAISKNTQYSYWYAKYAIKGRWELGEPAISQDAYSSYWYAIEVIEGRLPDFMHNQMILGNNEYTKKYIEFISKNSFLRIQIHRITKYDARRSIQQSIQFRLKNT